MIFCIAYQCFWVESYLRFLVQTKRRDMFPRKTTLKFLKFPPIDTILYSFLSRFWHLFTELTGHVAIALVSFSRWLIQFLYELSTKFTENSMSIVPIPSIFSTLSLSWKSTRLSDSFPLLPLSLTLISQISSSDSTWNVFSGDNLISLLRSQSIIQL